MRILEIITSPWAIIPAQLIEMQTVYLTHTRGEKIDLAAIEARIGRPLNNETKAYDVTDNGTAIVYLDGVISKRMNFFQKISGGVSSQLVTKDFMDAMANPQVKSIVLYIDSPGGSVDGTQDLAQTVFSARGQGKPIIAFTDGMMASGAYWIGAAAERVYISNDTTMVGSIGVVARHIDVSKAEEQMGIKTTEITAGRYKRIASEYAPLGESGRQSIQDALDYIYSVFANDISKFRGLSAEPVKDGKGETIPWADGRIFNGKEAIDAGLVDGVSTWTDLISKIEENPQTYLVRAKVEDNLLRRVKK